MSREPGTRNIAIGITGGAILTSGTNGTAIGYREALLTGRGNTAMGVGALDIIPTGNNSGPFGQRPGRIIRRSGVVDLTDTSIPKTSFMETELYTDSESESSDESSPKDEEMKDSEAYGW